MRSEDQPVRVVAGTGQAAPEVGGEHPGRFPRLPRVFVPRPQLWERLDLATQSAATLLIGPVGAGKTLSVAGWLRQPGNRHADSATWIASDTADGPDQLADLLQDPVPQTPDDGSPQLERRPALVIVDDAHVLPPAVLRRIDQRLNKAPESIRLLLISRWDLPLTRLLPELLGDLTTLRGDLLRLSEAECALLITEHARTAEPEVVRAVTARTEGWSAAVVLAARAIAATADPVAAAQALSTGRTSVVDTVAGEFFSTLSSRQRHLLLCTGGEGIVSSLTATHLTNDRLAPELLAELEAAGLPVSRVPTESVPGSADDTSYRIHPLLVEVVRRRVAAGGVDVARAQSTVHRAVRLDLARGHSAGAFSRLLAVNLPEAAAEVLPHEGVRMVLGDGRTEVADFVRSHPESVASHPQTWFTLAMDRWYDGDLEAARHWMGLLLDRDTQADVVDPVQLAIVRLWLGHLGPEPLEAGIAEATECFQRTMSTSALSARDDSLLPLLARELGIAQSWHGDLARAEVSLTRAISLSSVRGWAALGPSAMSHLALAHYMDGREHACLRLAGEALALTQTPGAARLPFTPSRAALRVSLVELPSARWRPDEAASSNGLVLHTADHVARFWTRIHQARMAVRAGSVVRAEQLLATMGSGPAVRETLPRHLQVVLQVERAFLATLAGDRSVCWSHASCWPTAGVRAGHFWSPGWSPIWAATARPRRSPSPRPGRPPLRRSRRSGPWRWSPPPSCSTRWASRPGRGPSCRRPSRSPRCERPRCPSSAGSDRAPR